MEESGIFKGSAGNERPPPLVILDKPKAGARGSAVRNA